MSQYSQYPLDNTHNTSNSPETLFKSIIQILNEFYILFGSSHTISNGMCVGESLYVCQVFLYLFAQFQFNGWELCFVL